MHSLPVFLRLAGRPVILIGSGEAALAKRRLLERAGANVVDEDDAAALAIVAIEDEAEAVAAVARLEVRGILVNATDRPELCDFTLPSIVDRDPVIIAIGTGGASAGLAKALRQRLEAILPPRLGALASALFSARGRMKRRWPDPNDRRRAIDAALEGALDPFSGDAADRVDAWLSDPDLPVDTGVRTFVIGSADPDQLTLEAARMLGRADYVVHSPGISVAILQRARADATRIESDAPPDPLPSGLVVQLVLAKQG